MSNNSIHQTIQISPQKQTQVSFQPPVGDGLRFYNRSLPGSQQSPAIPKVFCDAMSVREAVFVNEMKAIPLRHHTDADDARSYHWVVYAPESSSDPSKVKSQPVGTVRLVPYPHHPHPEPGARLEPPGPEVPIAAETVFLAAPPVYKIDRKTTLHDGKELYLTLGRTCVIKEFRGEKLADLLIQSALDWAAKNPEFPEIEGMKWKGLVRIHAHEKAITMWQRNGFVVDDGMGQWFEAGLRHVGMFCRLDLKTV